MFAERRYATREQWEDAAGTPFTPGTNYVVGGNTKLFGASMPRFQRSDFAATVLAEGTSPAWPFTYDDIAPHYDEAERIYRVHGDPADDRDRHGAAYPYPAVPHEPYVADSGVPSAQGRRPADDDPARDRPATRRHLHPLRHLRRVPLPAAREIRRRGRVHRARARSRRRAPDQRVRTTRGDDRRRDARRRRGDRPRRPGAPDRGARRRRLGRRRELGRAPPAVGHRGAPGGPRERLRRRGAPLHGPQQHGPARRASAAPQPGRLPEDARGAGLHRARLGRPPLPARLHAADRQGRSRGAPWARPPRAASGARVDRASQRRLVAVQRGPARPAQPDHDRAERPHQGRTHAEQPRDAPRLRPHRAAAPARCGLPRHPHAGGRDRGQLAPGRGRSAPATIRRPRPSPPTAARTRSRTSSSSTRPSSRPFPS